MTCRYHNRVKGGYYCRWFGASVGKECGDCDGYRDPKPKGEQRHISEHPHAVKGTQREDIATHAVKGTQREDIARAARCKLPKTAVP
jgi:hypothetical protein